MEGRRVTVAVYPVIVSAGHLLKKDSPLYIPKSTVDEKQPRTEVGSQWNTEEAFLQRLLHSDCFFTGPVK